ncbi:HI0074 family nucleotidyltransferase substrate-binding subunit [Granulicella arctica]|uniref:Nucleotidyltransferase substrate binding protein (TIGR01987 family) n=1 Tax=Granulicella arctica TaxID=940613 RepID=A0A7Y9PHR3_9BACT|nr:HI0074 family nucleotidyltransferase substrate-binding subunit [Granulicella arctica]NYF80120.1 nucleotidyltransferase substrate binding protein (TIGR01987 family) [Granulicella arctica]
MDSLDVTPLASAIRQFGSALEEYGREPERTLLRDGLIQRFEFTYSLCERMLRRFLEAASGGGEDVDAMSFPALIRTASEKGLLLHGWDRWSEFRRARNKTSHTYSEAAAVEVLEQLPAFLTEAQYLLERLS